MNFKKVAADYLTFSRKDRIAILVLLGLILLVLLIPKLVGVNGDNSINLDDTAWFAMMKSLEIQDSQASRIPYHRKITNYKRSESYASTSKLDWNNTNAPDRNRSSLPYAAHWVKDAQRRMQGSSPYAVSWDKDPERRTQGSSPYALSWEKDAGSRTQGSSAKPFQFARDGPKEIDVNLTDSLGLIALPGIGIKLAARILKFREKLGGFYAVEQVKETFGLPDSTYQRIRKYLKLVDTVIRRININTADEERLRSHPYIRWDLSKPILAYRNEHGPFQKLEDLKKVVAVTNEVYEKIAPYLSIE